MTTKDLIPFKPGQSGNPNGRPRSLLRQARDQGYTKDDFRRFLEDLLGVSENDLIKIVEESKNGKAPQPIIVTNIAMALLKDYKKGQTPTLDSVLDRTIGKPRQTVDLTSSDNSMSPLSSEDRALLDNYYKERYKAPKEEKKDGPTKRAPRIHSKPKK